MNNTLKRIFVYGFPGRYGGAGTELHHQIVLWKKMGMEIHIIPSWSTYKNEDLYPEMIERGVIVHEANDWDSLEAGDPVLGFCNSEFLNKLPDIHARTKRTIFINCMTWLFEKEKECMAQGLISMFLYQNEEVRQNVMPKLKAFNRDPNVQFHTFVPYFDMSNFSYVEERDSEFFGCGRISRQDADKFARNTLHIYDGFVSPKLKKALFLGFDHRSEQKIGKPFDWIKTAKDQRVVSQQDFYKHCEIVLQPTDTTENWPRVGFEAMSSGSVLIVDNRGGWRQLVEHGKTGWLCNHERDFIYYASKMAYEPELRAEMALLARERAQVLGGWDAAWESWSGIFEKIAQLPE